MSGREFGAGSVGSRALGVARALGLPITSGRLGGWAALRYVDEWIASLDDITERVSWLGHAALSDPMQLPQEAPYPLPEAVARRVGATVTESESDPPRSP